ncbi:hypothetical protein Ndes2526B_g01101 [Nannochloris sp. 'desiccata']
MRQKAEYSDKYGCNIQFDCGGERISKISHGALNNKDIDGAQPKRFTAERARPHPDPSSDLNNQNRTTEGRSRFRAPSQPRNPLAPEYNLPPLPPAPEVEAQKFIRNTLDVSDIPGSKVRVPRNLIKPDNALKTSDIEGSQPRESGGTQQHHAHPDSSSKPHNDMRMDVSDIATKVKQPSARKEQGNLVAGVKDGLGKAATGAHHKKEYFDSLRKHGSDVTRARDQAQSTFLAAVSTNLKTKTSQSSVASALEIQFRKIDKHNSGFLEPKEFETAVQKSGLEISKTLVQEVSKALEAASSSGMVAYQDVLTRMYDNIEASSSCSSSALTASPAASGNCTTQPQWYISRQRRIKTEVALCMGQQPEATAASAAYVETPQEKARRQTRATGKKIQGLSRPGEYENTGSASASNGEMNNTNTSYWFADYQKASDTTAGNAKDYHGGGGNGAGGLSELWFSKAGEDDKALKEMGVWRPTKDASIGIDFAKRKNAKNYAKADRGNGERNEKQGLAPAKPPPVVKAKPAPP